jgi:hypothetical protein
MRKTSNVYSVLAGIYALTPALVFSFIVFF